MDPSSQNLLLFLFRNRKALIAAPLIAAVVAAVASGPWFITPLYESSVVVFPSTTNSASKALLPQNTYQDEDFPSSLAPKNRPNSCFKFFHQTPFSIQSRLSST